MRPVVSLAEHRSPASVRKIPDDISIPNEVKRMPIRKAENDLVVRVENGPSDAAGAILIGQRSARGGQRGLLGYVRVYFRHRGRLRAL